MDPFYAFCVASGQDLDDLQQQVTESYMAAYAPTSAHRYSPRITVPFAA